MRIQIPHEESFHSNTNMSIVKSEVAEKKNGPDQPLSSALWMQRVLGKAVDSILNLAHKAFKGFNLQSASLGTTPKREGI